jgi:hypothetical protein
VADQPASEPTAGSGHAVLTAQYERLRQVALAGHAEGWRYGLGVLATRGMTGWMDACRAVEPQAPQTVPTRSAAGSYVLADSGSELVTVMAAMALAHL